MVGGWPNKGKRRHAASILFACIIKKILLINMTLKIIVLF